MSATVADWAGWWAAEALTCDPPWKVTAPYGRRRNMSGAPDLVLARGGRVVLVWLRPASDPRPTKAQREWLAAIGAAAAEVDDLEGVSAPGWAPPPVAAVVAPPSPAVKGIAQALLNHPG